MKRRHKLFLWIFFIVLFLIAFILRAGHKELVSPLPKFYRPSLKQVTEDILKDTKGRYGIYIKNFRTKESFYLNENQSFEPGSLYKLWVMGAVFEKIKQDNLKEDKILAERIEDLNKIFEISPEEAELKDGEIEMNVNSALSQMITISHNYAALLLTKEVGVSKIGGLLKKYDFKDSSLGDELKTTPRDIGEFYEMLLEGKIVNEQYSQKMLELLRGQEIKDRIPKLLPSGVEIAHKTADFGYFEHDGGIVYGPKGNYVIVILTETEFPEVAAEKIALISEAVYKYFSR